MDIVMDGWLKMAKQNGTERLARDDNNNIRWNSFGFEWSCWSYFFARGFATLSSEKSNENGLTTIEDILDIWKTDTEVLSFQNHSDLLL